MISVEELKGAFDAGGAKNEELWEAIMKEVDDNGDGQISMKEFVDSMESLMKK